MLNERASSPILIVSRYSHSFANTPPKAASAPTYAAFMSPRTPMCSVACDASSARCAAPAGGKSFAHRSREECTPTPTPVDTMMAAQTLPPTASSLPRPQGALCVAGTRALLTAARVTTSESRSVSECAASAIKPGELARTPPAPLPATDTMFTATPTSVIWLAARNALSRLPGASRVPVPSSPPPSVSGLGPRMLIRTAPDA
mmetsp:Transcript_15762/g.40183  ORF Transcript_15762/g.40183 Transcript_15762/m.40183 type:complete len:203 (+) Transcript_15762:927-1535(+)